MKNKKLYRSKKDRAIAGVCAGMAEYFGIDPIIMRLLFLVFLFAGFGLLIYIISWIFIPSK
jgi:phage shock protein PspC (stress-responsive transcriptional regulator)